jgi:hypothetical protein
MRTGSSTALWCLRVCDLEGELGERCRKRLVVAISGASGTACSPTLPRPVKGSLQNAWPSEIQRRVLDRWTAYGYRGDVPTGLLSEAPIA